MVPSGVSSSSLSGAVYINAISTNVGRDAKMTKEIFRIGSSRAKWCLNKVFELRAAQPEGLRVLLWYVKSDVAEEFVW